MKVELFLVLLIIVSFATFSYLTSDRGGFTGELILLKSRSVVPVFSGESLAGLSGRHVIIQLNHIPSRQEKEQLAGQGIHLLDYLPKNAWLASVDSLGVSALSVHPAVTFVGALENTDKISPNIREYGPAAWSRNEDGSIDLIVVVFSDVPREEAAETIGKYGIVASSGKDNIWTIRMEEVDINALAGEDAVQWIEDSPAPLAISNDGSRSTISVDTIQSVPYGLDGTGVVAAEWDEGYASHTDFNSRKTIGDPGEGSNALHSTHVAGTVLGDGSRSAAKGGTALQWRGMAPNATLITYEWPNTLSEIYDEINDSVAVYSAILSTNSWGYDVQPVGCDAGMGNYDTFTRSYDMIVSGETASVDGVLNVIFSAGNERDKTYCQQSTILYNTTTGPGGTAKDVITVGAVTKSEVMSTFSSWGPTDDGRIKPDVVAAGVSIKSTDLSDGYSTLSGTSMAAPAVAGAVVLMHEIYRGYFGGSDPAPATVKGILIHTAKDLGNTGPDFSNGWGLVNATAAVNKIIENSISDFIIVGNVGNGENDTYSISVAGDSEIKFTLVWDDYPGSVGAAKALVNDLDLVVTNSTGDRFYPWTLDPDNPGNAAVKTARDDTNNVEQVLVSNPDNGLWVITVSGESVPQGPQNYSLISSNSFDVTGPEINFVSPTPGNSTIVSENHAYINVTVSNDTDTAILEWNGTNETMSNSSDTNWFLNKTGLSDGDYDYVVYANDTSGNLNVSESRTLEIFMINIESPQNTSYTVSSLDFNITINRSLTNATFTVGSGDNNTMDNDTLVHYFNVSLGVLEGVYNATFWANDTQGVVNSKSIFFAVDLTSPNWSSNETNIVSEYSPSTPSFFNMTWSDNMEMGAVLIEGNWSGSDANYSMYTEGMGVYQFNATLPAGDYFWMSHANDTAGNLNSSDAFLFSVERLTTSVALLFNGSSLNSTYEIGETANITATLNTNKNVSVFINNSQVSEGNPAEYFWGTSQNSLGIYNITASFPGDNNNTASSQQLNLTLQDTAAPSITAISLFPSFILQGEPINVSANVTDSGTISSAWINVSNSSFSATGEMSNVSGFYNISFNTTGLEEGGYNVSIFANDSGTNEGNASAGSFRISQAKNITLLILDSDGNELNVTLIEIFYNGSLVSRNLSEENSSSIEYESLPAGVWDVRVSTSNFNVTLRINVSDNTTGNVSIDRNISSSGMSLPSGTSKFGIIMATETGLVFESAVLDIVYNESEINESYISLLACHLWSLGGRACGGSWVNMTSNASINAASNVVTVSTSTLSAFSPAQSIFCGDGTCNGNEACSSCSADCGSCQSTDDTGTTGGPGGSAPPATSNDEPGVQDNQQNVTEAPQKICEPGNRVCDSDTVLECNGEGTEYSVVEACQYECNAGKCRGPPQVCAPGKLRCTGDVLQECNSEGVGFETKEVCEFGCSEGKCDEQTDIPEMGYFVFVIMVAVILISLFGIVRKFRVSGRRGIRYIRLSGNNLNNQ